MHREARTEPPVRVLQATFRDVGSAHRAVEALERAGVDGQAIVLRDPAASQARDPRHTRALDARGMHRFGGGIVRGGVAGGLVGAVLGAAVALVLSGPLPWGGPVACRRWASAGWRSACTSGRSWGRRGTRASPTRGSSPSPTSRRRRSSSRCEP
ncbi:MAG: hypothetical protein M5U14_17010 [Acidimicrobiia bacterium]|nr:hypothetical protein [Acidimicrobiia bacterium]